MNMKELMRKSYEAFLDVCEYLHEQGLKTEKEIKEIRDLGADGKLNISSFNIRIDRGAEYVDCGPLNEDDLNVYTAKEEHTITVYGSYKKLLRLAWILEEWDKGRIKRLKKYYISNCTSASQNHVQHTEGDCLYAMTSCGQSGEKINEYWKKPIPFITFSFTVELEVMNFINVSSPKEAKDNTPFNNL